ncbi:hypothetical protein HU200_031555 [Digitaria exilis]|uniref:Glycosyltransferase n=1 Tax=Digitaria exilis TaxID=1010633 RepID=A0A835BPY2_9POAL|nr:hypothetical protein HU200_031555 [Digitaria exilis]
MYPSDDGDDDQDGDPTMRGLKILPPQVKLRAGELPWLVGDSATQRSRFAFWLQTLHRARDFRWVLVNSFPDENAADDDAHRLVAIARHGPHVLPIAPALLPGGDLATAERTKQQQGPCGDKNPSMWRADSTCIAWLDAQRAGSVVYVSFGSWVGSIGPDKVRELALGLEATGRPFLWALKRDPSWRAGLPDGFAARVAGRGKVVDWAPQEDVLRHGAVGCYLTHCGWNSTMEAVRHGVPLLCYPVAGDQFINCAYITGPWGIGLRLGAAMGREDVRGGIGRVMGDDEDGGGEGRRLREKVRALRERVVAAEARRAADRNVRSFVDDIRRDHHPLLTQIYSRSMAESRRSSKQAAIELKQSITTNSIGWCPRHDAHSVNSEAESAYAIQCSMQTVNTLGCTAPRFGHQQSALMALSSHNTERERELPVRSLHVRFLQRALPRLDSLHPSTTVSPTGRRCISTPPHHATHADQSEEPAVRCSDRRSRRFRRVVEVELGIYKCL